MPYKHKVKKSGYCRIRKTIFVNGKQKTMFCEYFDGKPINEWREECNDPIQLLADGRYDVLDMIYEGDKECGERKIIHMNKEAPPF